jgi:hypothetical protein
MDAVMRRIAVVDENDQQQVLNFVSDLKSGLFRRPQSS